MIVSFVSLSNEEILQSTDVVTPDAGVILQLEDGPVALVTFRFVGRSVTLTLVAVFGPVFETTIL